jgi:hypothetical protein
MKTLIATILLASLLAVTTPAKAQVVEAPIVGSGIGILLLPWVGALYDNNQALSAMWKAVCEGIGGTWHPQNDHETSCEGGAFAPDKEPK